MGPAPSGLLHSCPLNCCNFVGQLYHLAVAAGETITQGSEDPGWARACRAGKGAGLSSRISAVAKAGGEGVVGIPEKPACFDGGFPK